MSKATCAPPYDTDAKKEDYRKSSTWSEMLARETPDIRKKEQMSEELTVAGNMMRQARRKTADRAEETYVVARGGPRSKKSSETRSHR
jgi:hypothetical protein